MKRKFIFLINPISGTKDKDSIKTLIEKKSRQENIPFQILETQANGNYSSLEQQVKAENITDVIICGGDGSINQVASSLRQTAVNIGIVPMGSGNGLALAAGIPRDPAKALSIIFKGKASCVDSFYINGKFSCMLCGLG